ncbi:TIGR02234 family membrane protein [Antrihabitans cavernicola]|uniref:TIGR02234 family membrane protein n=1 Tax=Antrihabitans cavernicola TaxID=2495913 RepID=A0A5A7SA14_9NOCA|nr:TIGR02234 family membrane protein [Spelaeibacter cavernicola]KAA0021051.1 TIGR02234 family membrane protein [Spelaeibacter cavernicola]
MTAAPVPDKSLPTRRSPVPAVVLIVAAAACLWGSSRLTWVRVHSSDGLGEAKTDSLLGSTWVAVLTPLALTLVAAIAALFALRGRLRQVLGVVIALVAAACAVPALALLIGATTDERAKQLAELPGRSTVTSVDTFAFPPALALVGAIAAFLASLLLVRRQTAGPAMSSKYDNPAARRADVARQIADDGDDKPGEQPSERVLWDALDAGEDPTAGGDGEAGTRR